VTRLSIRIGPRCLARLALELDDFDARSTTSRYGEDGIVSRKTGNEGEFWMDVLHLRNYCSGKLDGHAARRGGEPIHAQSS
jgi:hypothetical protein